jgi:hypothetical protein
MKFAAVDDSGRLRSSTQANNPDLCCETFNLYSLLNVSVKVSVDNGTRPAFLNPTPPHNTRFELLARFCDCGMGLYTVLDF